MRSIRVTLSLILALSSSAAVADWAPVGNGDYIATSYVDRTTIKRNGAMATMSGMYDFRRQDFTPEGKGLYSTVVLREYDCAQRRVRLLSSIDFAGQMGIGGAVDKSARTGRWEDIVAGALDEAFWNIACKGG